MDEETEALYDEYVDDWHGDRENYYSKVLADYEDQFPCLGEDVYQDIAEEKATEIFGKQPWDYKAWAAKYREVSL